MYCHFMKYLQAVISLIEVKYGKRSNQLTFMILRNTGTDVTKVHMAIYPDYIK